MTKADSNKAEFISMVTTTDPGQHMEISPMIKFAWCEITMSHESHNHMI